MNENGLCRIFDHRYRHFSIPVAITTGFRRPKAGETGSSSYRYRNISIPVVENTAKSVFVQEAIELDNERAVPIDDSQIPFGKGAMDADGFIDLQVAETFRGGFGQESGDFPAVLAKPGAGIAARAIFAEVGQAEDGICFRVGWFGPADHGVLNALANLLAQ